MIKMRSAADAEGQCKAFVTHNNQSNLQACLRSSLLVQLIGHTCVGSFQPNVSMNLNRSMHNTK